MENEAGLLLRHRELPRAIAVTFGGCFCKDLTRSARRSAFTIQFNAIYGIICPVSEQGKGNANSNGSDRPYDNVREVRDD